MKLLGLNNKPLVAGGKAIIPPASGGDFKANVFKVKTPLNDTIGSSVYGGFIEVPLFKNGFIFLSWDITTNLDLEFNNYAAEITYVCMPSVNINKGIVTIQDVMDTFDIMAADNWIKYDAENRV